MIGGFEIASITKQFTAVAILQLAEAGKLSVQDPVSKFYSQAPESWHDITVQELLTPTSGLANNELKDFTKGIAVPYTPDQLIQTFRNRPLELRLERSGLTRTRSTIRWPTLSSSFRVNPTAHTCLSTFSGRWG
jgi:CubicO group peptidase (beta-lactamase class C family)